MGDLGWATLPFSMSETGKMDRNIEMVSAGGAISVVVDSPSTKECYYEIFRLPGANTGTPGESFGGPDGSLGGRRGGPGGFGPPPGRGGDFPPRRGPNQ